MESGKKKKVIIGAAIGALVLIAVFVVILLNKDKIKASTMRLFRIVGEVTLEDGKKKKTILDNLRLADGNALSTASESLASVGLDDTKIISIEENSRAEFYQKGKKLELTLTKGRLFFDVQQPLAENESLDIKSSTMVVGIRGTSGYVWEDPAQGIQYIYITDGHVKINGYNPLTGANEEVTVGPGQRATAYMNDDGTFNTFIVEDVTEEDLPVALIRELFNNPDTLERVLKATGYDRNKLLKRLAEDDGSEYISMEAIEIPDDEPEVEPEPVKEETKVQPEPVNEPETQPEPEPEPVKTVAAVTSTPVVQTPASVAEPEPEPEPEQTYEEPQTQQPATNNSVAENPNATPTSNSGNDPNQGNSNTNNNNSNTNSNTNTNNNNSTTGVIKSSSASGSIPIEFPDGSTVFWDEGTSNALTAGKRVTVVAGVYDDNTYKSTVVLPASVVDENGVDQNVVLKDYEFNNAYVNVIDATALNAKNSDAVLLLTNSGEYDGTFPYGSLGIEVITADGTVLNDDSVSPSVCKVTYNQGKYEEFAQYLINAPQQDAVVTYDTLTVNVGTTTVQLQQPTTVTVLTTNVNGTDYQITNVVSKNSIYQLYGTTASSQQEDRIGFVDANGFTAY